MIDPSFKKFHMKMNKMIMKLRIITLIILTNMIIIEQILILRKLLNIKNLLMKLITNLTQITIQIILMKLKKMEITLIMI